MDTLIVPAIIAKNQHDLDDLLMKVQGKVKRVQIDIMDGKFVPNTSLNFNFTLPPTFEYEAHLMVENPLKWVEKNGDLIDIVILHIETLDNIDEAINYVRGYGVQTNLALVPQTSYKTVIPYLTKIDGILVMTVEPGSYCVKKEFRTEPLETITKLREWDKTIPIEVDGCMNSHTIRLTHKAGANIFASGSYILKSKDVDQAIQQLEDAVK